MAISWTKDWHERNANNILKSAWRYNAARWLIYLICVALVGGFFYLLYHLFMDALASYQRYKPIDIHLETFRNFMLGIAALIAPFGFALAVIRTWSSWKQARVSDQKLQAEALSTSISLLGHEELTVRLGAIYSLETLAKTSPSLHVPIMEALCAYVREMSPWRNKPTIKSKVGLLRNRADIQTIMTVIGRRDRGNEPKQFRLDLHDADLRGITLSGGHFERVLFTGAHFEGSNLAWCHLEDAFMIGAYLKGTNLVEAFLHGTRLNDIEFNNVLLFGIKYDSQTWISGADFKNAHGIPTKLRQIAKEAEKGTTWPDVDSGAWESF